MRLVSITFTAIFIIFLIVYLYYASKRQTKKNLYSLGANLITFLETFIVTKVVVNVFGAKVASSFSSLLLKEEEWTKMDATSEFVRFIFTIVFGVVLFYLIYIVLVVINHLLKRLIFKVVNKVPYKKYESEKESNKFVNVGVGLVSFLVFTFAFLFPFGALVNVTSYAKKDTGYSMSNSAFVLFDNPIFKAYSFVGTEPFFNSLTAIKENKNINSTKELKGLTTIGFSFLKAKESKRDEIDTEIFRRELTTTYLLPSFLSEVCANAATKFKNNEPFLGVTLSIPTDKSKNLYLDTLEVISNWQREDLVDDIETTFEVYSLLQENGVKDIENPENLLPAMEKDEFSEALFLALFHNKDFKKLVPTFMNFGVDTILESVGISSNGDYVSKTNYNNMTDEEIVKEARIFSLALRQIEEIKNLDASIMTMDDFNRIADNLNKIKDSKLLNDVLYNVVYKLLENI